MVDFAANIAVNTRTAHSDNGQYKSIQAWKTKKTGPAEQQILGNLEKAAAGRVGSFDVELKTSMAYAPNANQKTQSHSTEAFQFEDVVDIINPLHHLPVISMVYRGLTGDTLHPMSQIIGGALYGGPVGAVTGTANAISQVQTGKDIGDHALGFVGIGNSDADIVDKYNPETQLNTAAENFSDNAPLEDLPGSAMAFVNLSEPNRAYQRMEIAEGRTAGSMIVKNKMASYRQTINTEPLTQQGPSMPPPKTNLDTLPPREEITSVTLSALPPRQDV